MPIAFRADFNASMVRAAAKRSKDGAQARRLLALAAIYEGATRTEASRIGGVTLQIIRDWALKFNAHGPDGLIDRKAPGPKPRLNDEHRAVNRHRRLTPPKQSQSGGCDADRRSDPAPNRNEGLVIIEPQKGASGENHTEESDDPLAISIACAVLRGFQASDSIHSHVRRFKLQARIFFCSRSSVSNRPPLGMACAIR
jgi:hypothetical protein